MNQAIRQPVIWLMGLILLGTIIGIVLTIRSASGMLAESPDEVVRIAQVQTMDDARDRRAGELGLSAVLELGTFGLRLESTATQLTDLQSLELHAIHATDPDQDRHIELHACAPRRWCADTVLPEARFHFELKAPDDSWRIGGDRALTTTRVHLRPAWSTP